MQDCTPPDSHRECVPAGACLGITACMSLDTSPDSLILPLNMCLQVQLMRNFVNTGVTSLRTSPALHPSSNSAPTPPSAPSSSQSSSVPVAILGCNTEAPLLARRSPAGQHAATFDKFACLMQVRAGSIPLNVQRQ